MRTTVKVNSDLSGLVLERGAQHGQARHWHLCVGRGNGHRYRPPCARGSCVLSCFILRVLSARWVVVPPSYEEEAKPRKVLIERTADLLVNTLVIPDPSRLLPLPPSSEPFVTHPSCLVHGVHSTDIMIGIPRCEDAVVTGGCASCHRDSRTLALPVWELPLTGLTDRRSLTSWSRVSAQ